MDYGYNTSYGGQGGAGGGGFMPGSQTGESGGAKRSYGKDTLRPCTVKQLLEAHHPHPDAEHFMIDDAETTQITMVGQIRNVSEQTTNVTYKIDDGTGIIEAKIWVDAEANSDPDNAFHQKKQQLKEQGYARVWGRLKSFNSKRHVGATMIRPITDYNEVQYHLLEATAVHLHFTRGPIEAIRQAKDGANGTSHDTTNGGGYGQDAGGFPSAISGASMNAKKVYKCIKEAPQVNEGVHMHEIASRLGMDIDSVARAGEELGNLGAVYTTVDDQTWAILDV